MQQVKLKSGSKFLDLKNKQEIDVKKVDLKGVHIAGVPNPEIWTPFKSTFLTSIDLKGVHIAGVPNPVPLTFAIRAVKEKTWIQK